MSDLPVVPIVASTVAAATPLVYAALGETVVEKTGVLNLGVEGMMLMGAVTGCAVTLMTGHVGLGFVAGAGAGMAMSLVFAVLTLTLQANQVATGLALTLFGLGLSAFVGHGLAGRPIAGLHGADAPLRDSWPVVGRLLFGHDPMVYGAVLLFIAVQWFLTRTHAGLQIRAVGEAPGVARAIGTPVLLIRYLAVLFGGATAGLAGAYVSLAQTPMWVEGMSAGKGWIALALVVFGTWKPVRVVLGALLFGGVTVLQLYAQGFGLAVPSELWSALPYLVTIAVLVLICRNPVTVLLNRPAALGSSFHAEA